MVTPTPIITAGKLGVAQHQVNAIRAECGEPEKINDHNTTAPSKRLEALSDRFKKTSSGIAIAEEIGIGRMREACSLFDSWLTKLESLVVLKTPPDGKINGLSFL